MSRDPFNIQWLGYAHDISKSFGVRTRGLFKKCCDLEKIPGVRVALVVAVDKGPISIYNEPTAGYALSRPRRKKVFHYRPAGSHQLIEGETLPTVPEPHDSQVMQIATSLLHLSSPHRDLAEMQRTTREPRFFEQLPCPSQHSVRGNPTIASMLNPVD